MAEHVIEDELQDLRLVDGHLFGGACLCLCADCLDPETGLCICPDCAHQSSSGS